MPDRVVVDSSLAMKWVIPQTYAAEAAALLQAWGSQGMQLLAPHLFLSEAANALYQYVRVQGTGIANISLATAQNHLNLLVSLIALVQEDLSLMQHAQQLAYEAQRPATYDDTYAALALREGCEFWTADERYWNRVKHLRPWVRCLADPMQSQIASMLP
ncbi:MAG TPA: type II toxin-antitoxin system VapC family toxin [Chloroflexota bacterium]|nr:type II toxin-antitoxin system VapC family toxin [Chloroflexota bacterium]